MESTKLSGFEKALRIASLLFVAAMLSSPAMAQSVSGLCMLVSYYKMFLGVVAMLAVLFYVGNSFFGKSALVAEIAQNVLIGCVVATLAGALVSATGLTASCSS
jgi:hypothetical protein